MGVKCHEESYLYWLITPLLPTPHHISISEMGVKWNEESYLYWLVRWGWNGMRSHVSIDSRDGSEMSWGVISLWTREMGVKCHEESYLYWLVRWEWNVMRSHISIDSIDSSHLYYRLLITFHSHLTPIVAPSHSFRFRSVKSVFNEITPYLSSMKSVISVFNEVTILLPTPYHNSITDTSLNLCYPLLPPIVAPPHPFCFRAVTSLLPTPHSHISTFPLIPLQSSHISITDSSLPS